MTSKYGYQENKSRSEFFAIFWPFFLSFIASRISTQIDLVMIADFGEKALSAFSVPSNVMILDTLFAFAVAPVVSLKIAKIRQGEHLVQEASRCLNLGLMAGVILTILGLAVYPVVTRIIISDQETLTLADQATFWLTLGIPMRLFQFISTMILHGSGFGSSVLYWSLGSIGLDLIFNWICIKSLGLGFAGAYTSTFIVSIGASLWSYALMRRKLGAIALMSFPSKEWTLSFLSSAGAEFLRLASLRVTGIVTLAIMSVGHDHGSSKLAAFGVISAFESFIFVPIVALMRTIGVYISRNPLEARETLPKIQKSALFFTAVAYIFMLASGEWIGREIYHLSPESMTWWDAYLLVLAVHAPLQVLVTIGKAKWQSLNRYAEVSRLEIVTTWTSYVPVLWLGSFVSSPVLTWSAYAITDIFSVFWLMYSDKQCEKEGSLEPDASAEC